MYISVKYIYNKQKISRKINKSFIMFQGCFHFFQQTNRNSILSFPSSDIILIK